MAIHHQPVMLCLKDKDKDKDKDKEALFNVAF